MADAATYWAESLQAWAVPEEILAQAPESPWQFPPALFARIARWALEDPEGSPSRHRALEALPDGGEVLDVGAGGGAASLPLAPPAACLTAVDQGREMLEQFATGAEARGVAHREVHGLWPDVAAEAGTADVVVCHHVVYNVADLAPFALALTAAARRRVVVELSDTHPTSNLNHMWKALHGIDRPTTPRAADAAAVLRDLGLDVGMETFERFAHWHDHDLDEMVAFTRRRLCVGPERDAEIAELLGPPSAQPPRRTVTLWWPGKAAS